MAFVETPGAFQRCFLCFIPSEVRKWTPLLAEHAEMCQYYFSIFREPHGPRHQWGAAATSRGNQGRARRGGVLAIGSLNAQLLPGRARPVRIRPFSTAFSAARSTRGHAHRNHRVPKSKELASCLASSRFTSFYYFLTLPYHQGVGRGCGVGRGLGVTLGVGETVGVGVGVGVGLGVIGGVTLALESASQAEPWRWRWRGTRRYLVVARDVSRRCRSAEVLGKEPGSRVALYARHPVLGCVVREVTDDHLELQVRIVLIQPDLEVLPRCVVGKKHRAPFDVEDAIRRNARDRGENTAVSTRETRAAAQTASVRRSSHRGKMV